MSREGIEAKYERRIEMLRRERDRELADLEQRKCRQQVPLTGPTRDKPDVEICDVCNGAGGYEHYDNQGRPAVFRCDTCHGIGWVLVAAT